MKSIDNLLRPEVQHFIRQQENSDEKMLVLKHKSVAGVSIQDIAKQIAGRKKARDKFPIYYNTTEIVYPPSLSLEQSSSEATAKFKSGLFEGNIAADLTGGLGVDSFFLSKKFKSLVFVEPDHQLISIAAHNHNILGARNINYINQQAENFAVAIAHHFDLIYIDPSRRNFSRKVVALADCQPDVIALLPKLLPHATVVMIKASPLLDISKTLNDLEFVEKVFVVSVDNECKELLFICKQQFQGKPEISAIDLKHNGTVHTDFSFNPGDELNSSVGYSPPLTFLYEANAAIMKSGAFKFVAEKFNLKKIAPNTHLYTSNTLEAKFPGRIFKIETELKSDPASLSDWLPDGKANVLTRNYPLTANQLRKKLRLKDGGEKFVIGFSGQHKKHLILSVKIS